MRECFKPLVSVVTPVYNDRAYLAECIESVQAQTYHNWNYTIVDNSSTDGSAELARGYASKDSRIRVVANEQFLRAIPNHNVALRQISPDSKYCKMVFADDWMFPECLERMVEAGEEEPSVGIIGAYALEGTRIAWQGLPYPSRCVFGREVCRRLFLDDLYVFGTATTVLYRADLVRTHDPFFNQANLHADTEACIAYLRTCDFGFVHQVLTFTRQRAASLSSLSTEINTHFAGMLHALVTYGRDYLTPAELDMCLQRQLMRYYSFLGKSVICGRDRKFWEYHKSKLIEMGFGFDRGRLARATLGKVCGAILDPKASFQNALKIAAARRANSRARTVRGELQKDEI